MKTTIKTISMMMVFAVASMGMAKADDISFTAKAGLNIANIGGGDVEESPDMKLGFHVGGLATYRLSDMLSVEGGLFLSTKGYQEEYSEEFMGETFEYKYAANLMYLDIPLLAKVTPVEGLGIYAGLQPSILLSAEAEVEFDGESETDDMSEFMRSLDLAFVIGAGYTHESGVSLSAGYDLGFLSLDEDGDADVFNRVIKISLGYTF